MTKGIQIVKNSFERMQMIDILLKYILWCNFLNNSDAQSHFAKNYNHSYLQYALEGKTY